MLSFLADENFDNDIVRGILRRDLTVDLVRLQDVGLSGAPDPEVLQWSAERGRILLTHDVATITKYVYQRVADRLPMPGVFEVSQTSAVGNVIDDILLLWELSSEDEWEGQVLYLPLKN